MLRAWPINCTRTRMTGIEVRRAEFEEIMNAAGSHLRATSSSRRRRDRGRAPTDEARAFAAARIRRPATDRQTRAPGANLVPWPPCMEGARINNREFVGKSQSCMVSAHRTPAAARRQRGAAERAAGQSCGAVLFRALVPAVQRSAAVVDSFLDAVHLSVLAAISPIANLRACA